MIAGGSLFSVFLIYCDLLPAYNEYFSVFVTVNLIKRKRSVIYFIIVK